MRRRFPFFSLVFILVVFFLVTIQLVNTTIIPQVDAGFETNQLALGNEQWIATYGGSGSDSAGIIQEASGGGYIIAGTTSSFGAGASDIWLLRLAQDGTVSWQKTYGGPDYEVVSALVQADDGGFVVTGYTGGTVPGSWDVWIFKVSSDGTFVWQKVYEGDDYDVLTSIQKTSDGYIVDGFTRSFGPGSYNAWFLKLDANGNIIWQKIYSGSNFDVSTDILPLPDGGFITAGNVIGTDGRLFKLDSNGDIVWQKRYQGSDMDVFNDIQITASGGYVVVGYTASFGAGLDDAWILKLDGNGDIIWQKVIGGSNYDGFAAVQETSDGSLIATGFTRSFSAGDRDGWIVKFSSGGEIIWQKIYGGSNNDRLGQMQLGSDGSFVVVGSTESWGAGESDVWVLKLDQQGDVANCDVITSSNAVISDTLALVQSYSATGQASGAVISDTVALAQNTTIQPELFCPAPITPTPTSTATPTLTVEPTATATPTLTPTATPTQVVQSSYQVYLPVVTK